MRRKFRKITVLLMLIAAIAALYFALRNRKTGDNNIQTNISNPVYQDQPEIKEITESGNKTEPVQEELAQKEEPAQNIPEKFSLDIPFYSQTPLSKWDAFHEEMCEEASVLNAGLYLEGKKLTKEQFEAELQKMQKAEKKEIGEWKSTTIFQTKKLVDVYFEGKVKSKIIESPTIEDIEVEVAAGNPVVVPLSGRDIGNPNFTPPGPVYHMLVIKGYNAQNFITNDVGTRKGDSYAYKKEVIMKNIHDWNEADIHKGEKRILVLTK